MGPREQAARKQQERTFRFPEGFFWGTATSAHQIEGGNMYSDWWKAEQEGMVPHKSGRACDSYSRYEEDFDLAKGMHNTAHRFSLEWARIEPEEGRFQEQEIEHYRKVIRAVKARGMEPFVTLHHFTLPQWFAEKGGWANKRAPEYFERYVRYVLGHLGGEIFYWVTLNEPMMLAMHGYVVGDWPPGHRFDLIHYTRAVFHLKEAHKRAYSAIHALAQDAVVGLSNQVTPMKVHGWNPLTRVIAFLGEVFWNEYMFRSTRGYLDFIGVNYYHVDDIQIGISRPSSWVDYRGLRLAEGTPTEMGWGIYSKGLYEVCMRLRKFHKPLYITENGIADADDDQRPDFIRDHLTWLHKAIEEGADVRGYFHWSLLDNFEWAEGFTKRFGLVRVDFDTFQRTPRTSAELYGTICKNNGLNI